jgi:hypothetical protein
MSRFKDFIYGYGKSLDLFPEIGSIEDDWKIIGKYMDTAIKKSPEIIYHEKQNKQKKNIRKKRR